MASGKVCTGFSHPVVAKYAASGSTVTYTERTILARGVEVSVDVETTDDNNFYADNRLAETAEGTFSSGSGTATVDGLKAAARELISGIGSDSKSTLTVGSDTVNVDNYGDKQKAPYVGFGFIVRYMEDGVTTYAPWFLPKIKFSEQSLSAATQEEDIEWQTQSLDFTILRDDTANHNWKRIAEDRETEEDAIAVLEAFMPTTT